MTDVIAGQTIGLLSQWYAYQGGPLVDLDTTPTIGITRVADGAVILAATTAGVTHPGAGSYGYGWTPALDGAPGLHLALWNGTASGGAVTASESINVIAPATGRVYASALEYQAYTGQTPPADIDRQLARASAFLDREVFRLCWFEADASTGRPTHPLVIAAFRDAVCAQVEWWDETGDELGVAGRYASVKLGTLALSRASASGSAPVSGREVAETAMEALRSPDLTPDVFVLGMVASC
jgi:hypothetical protein